MGFGDCVRARFRQADAPEGGILLMGHLDTVHPMGMLNEMPWREENGLCHGPGILDMKGGIVIALAALEALGRAGLTPPLPVTLLLNSRRRGRQSLDPRAGGSGSGTPSLCPDSRTGAAQRRGGGGPPCGIALQDW